MNNEIEIRKTIERAEKELALAKSQLEELNDPYRGIKHGDYGVNMEGQKRLFIWYDGELHSLREVKPGLADYLKDVQPDEYTIHGNIFK